MGDIPLISIVVIGYNVENTIQECLESCCNQKYENVQIIFIDDGSTDSTAQIVKDILVTNIQLEYYFQKNQGANSARKLGFSKVKGEFTIFIDGDDILDEECLNEMYQAYVLHPDCDIYTYDYAVFSEIGILEKKHSYLSGELCEKQFLKQILRHEIPHYLWNKMYSTEFLRKMPFEDIPSITMGDDLAACVRMGTQYPTVYAIDRKLYYYRENTNSVSRKPSKKYLELLTMIKDIEITLECKGLIDEYKEEIEFNYYLLFLFYVVRNKYKHTEVQEKIYRAWKDRCYILEKNDIIQDYNQSLGKTIKLLIWMTDNCFYVGRIIARLYGIVRRPAMKSQV